MQSGLARLTSERLPHAPMATIRITHTRARLTATTALSGSPAAYSSVQARGSTATVAASMGALAFTDTAGLSDGRASVDVRWLAADSTAGPLHACQLDADSLAAHFMAARFAVEQSEAVAGSMAAADTGKFIK